MSRQLILNESKEPHPDSCPNGQVHQTVFMHQDIIPTVVRGDFLEFVGM